MTTPPDRHRFFRDTFVCRESRYSLGVDDATGRLYFSTPVSGAVMSVEWEEHFEISVAEYELFVADPDAGDRFAEDCRMHRNQSRLRWKDPAP